MLRNLTLAVKLYAALTESPLEVSPSTLYDWPKTLEAVAASGRETFAKELKALPLAERATVVAYTRALEPLRAYGQVFEFADKAHADSFAKRAGTVKLVQVSRLNETTVNTFDGDLDEVEAYVKADGGKLAENLVERDFERLDVELPHVLLTAGLPISLVERLLLQSIEAREKLNESLVIIKTSSIEERFKGRIESFVRVRGRKVVGESERTVEALRRGGWLKAHPELDARVRRELGEDTTGSVPPGDSTSKGAPPDKGGVAKDQPDVTKGSPAKSQDGDKSDPKAPTEKVPDQEEGTPTGDVTLPDGTIVPEDILRAALGRMLQVLSQQIINKTGDGKPTPPEGDEAGEEENGEQDPEAQTDDAAGKNPTPAAQQVGASAQQQPPPPAAVAQQPKAVAERRKNVPISERALEELGAGKAARDVAVELLEGRLEMETSVASMPQAIESPVHRLYKEYMKLHPHERERYEVLSYSESAPPGWEPTVKAMKKNHGDIDNPYALAWWMKGQGYTPHKDESQMVTLAGPAKASSEKGPGFVTTPGQDLTTTGIGNTYKPGTQGGAMMDKGAKGLDEGAFPARGTSTSPSAASMGGGSVPKPQGATEDPQHSPRVPAGDNGTNEPARGGAPPKSETGDPQRSPSPNVGTQQPGSSPAPDGKATDSKAEKQKKAKMEGGLGPWQIAEFAQGRAFLKARVADAAKFVPSSIAIANMPGKDGVMCEVGKLAEGSGRPKILALMFPRDRFDEAKARAWMERYLAGASPAPRRPELSESAAVDPKREPLVEDALSRWKRQAEEASRRPSAPQEGAASCSTCKILEQYAPGQKCIAHKYGKRLAEGEEPGERDEIMQGAAAWSDAALQVAAMKAAAFKLVTDDLVKIEAVAKALDAKKAQKMAEKLRARFEELHGTMKECLAEFEEAHAKFDQETGASDKGIAPEPETPSVVHAAPVVSPAPVAVIPPTSPTAPAIPAPSALPVAPAAVSVSSQPVAESRPKVAVALERIVTKTTIPQRIAEGLSYREAGDAIRAECSDLVLDAYEVAEIHERIQTVESKARERRFKLTLSEDDRKRLQSVSERTDDAAARIAGVTANGAVATVGELAIEESVELLERYGDLEHRLLANDLRVAIGRRASLPVARSR